MLRIGLTGGIGSGKSTVARRLAGHGAHVIDADRLAREVVEPGTPGLAELVEEFGAGVLTPEGALDRAALAARVFGDDEARKRLNAIVHPKVGARTAELIAQAPPDAVVVHDVPLLVENRMAPLYHLVVVVEAPVDVRIDRLVRSRGLDEADARARVAAQATDEARRAVADVRLDNSGAPDEVLAAVDALWTERLAPYEANVRTRTPAHRGAPRIVAPDPAWPAQAERVLARLRLVAGPRALRVDHIGSTSVPGLVAKDVLDFQITVAVLEDAEHFTDALAEAGFPHLPEFGQDTPYLPGDDPLRWRKRTHAGADPARWVNIHIRPEGAPNWRYALLFPAWLRADPTARAEYERLKRDLAADSRTIPDYGTAKEPWFRQAHTRSEEWAAATGWQP